MKYVKGALAALVVALASLALGDYVNYDMDFLAGWWACLAYMTFTKD